MVFEHSMRFHVVARKFSPFATFSFAILGVSLQFAKSHFEVVSLLIC